MGCLRDREARVRAAQHSASAQRLALQPSARPAGSRPRWRKSVFFLGDGCCCTDPGRARRRRPAARVWFDRARCCASNHLLGSFRVHCQLAREVQQGAHLVHKTTSAGGSQHQHPQHTAPAHHFRSADRTRAGNASLLTLYSPSSRPDARILMGEGSGWRRPVVL